MPPRISVPGFSNSSSRPSPTRCRSEPQMPTSHSRKSSTGPTPVSPPRLHLRNILPASPDQPAFMPPPPSTPKAWVWQCHLCLTVYRLGCTRRCLDCAHTYCMSANPQTSKGTRGKKRRRPTRQCAAMFDYAGWEQWGSWKRKVLGLEATGRCDPKARDRAFARNRHDCWVDCDSPSQCFQRRYELALEAMKRQTHLLEANETERNVPLRLRPDDELMLDVPTVCAESAEDTEQADHEDFLCQSSDEPCHEPRAKKNKGEGREAWWDSRPSQQEGEGEGRGEEKGEGEGEEGSNGSLYGAEHDADEGWTAENSSDVQTSPVKALSVRNFTDSDTIDQDSDSDSDSSGWSSISSESEASSVETRVKD